MTTDQLDNTGCLLGAGEPGYLPLHGRVTAFVQGRSELRRELHTESEERIRSQDAEAGVMPHRSHAAACGCALANESDVSGPVRPQPVVAAGRQRERPR